MFLEKDSQWFKDWFNSPYYHILYGERNFEEAELFIDNLIRFLKPKEGSRFLDLACGKGRHSIYLNKKGFEVTGLDLSPESIAEAKKQENEKLDFYIHDMRKCFRVNYYDFVVNLFTSFGYFEHEKDDHAVIHSVATALKSTGLFVFDFFNAKKVMMDLVPDETKKMGNIEFHISRSIENSFICKRITFSDGGENHNYMERVKALQLNDLEKHLSVNKLKILHLFGNYQLADFDENTSERLIIIAKKE